MVCVRFNLWCQWWSAIRRTGNLGWTDQNCLDTRCANHDRSPGHVPLHMIKVNMESNWKNAEKPLFIPWARWLPILPRLWPYHVSHRRGEYRWYGCAMLCYVTQKEHLGLPNKQDVREGIVTYKIAAHALIWQKVILARKHVTTHVQSTFWISLEDQFNIGLDPKKRANFMMKPCLKSRRKSLISALCAARISARWKSVRCTRLRGGKRH